jgi:histidine triad (HIT) family protein
MKDDCIFCRIAAGKIPAEKVLENEHLVAFNDIHPQAPTHVLIVPRQHIASLNDIAGEHLDLIGHVFEAARDVARKAGVAEGGYRVILNTNRDAGQEVFHLHFHVMGGRRLGSMG